LSFLCDGEFSAIGTIGERSASSEVELVRCALGEVDGDGLAESRVCGAGWVMLDVFFMQIYR
jgi:hypothetical protein